MAQKPAVHIELRGEGWAVVREGNTRATSTHPTQSEAAESGRELARRDGTEFFLHGKNGQIREHRDYREGQTSTDEGIVEAVSETVADVVGGATDVVAQAAGGARQETGPEAADRGADQDDSVAEAASSRESTGKEIGEDVSDLTEAGSGEPFVAPEERYADYEIYDQYGERIGPLSDLFVDEGDEPEYVGVGIGLPENRSVLVPAEVITIDDRLRRMVVSHPRSLVETGPSLGYTEEVTPEFERRVRLHYGLDTEERAGYGAYYTGEAEPTEIMGTDPAPDLPDRENDDVRVRRSEEEIRVETREREAGELRVRKRVRTERERLAVPKKRIEVSVERVPVEEGLPTEEGAATAPQIGEEEIVVPVVEEEVVVEKRPVVKEEIRIRKVVVEDVEVVEEDVRREEVEIDDQTDRHLESHADQDEELESKER
ncbi:MAG: DUF2382 domain-containing protein [Actinomycetota bacterium]|nr:DUF2382 domain-containing protein [Actinomycetota bacterium]